MELELHPLLRLELRNRDKITFTFIAAGGVQLMNTAFGNFFLFRPRFEVAQFHTTKTARYGLVFCTDAGLIIV